MKIAYIIDEQIFPVPPHAGTERFIEDEILFLDKTEKLSIYCNRDISFKNQKWSKISEAIDDVRSKDFDLILSRAFIFENIELPCLTVTTYDGGVAKDHELRGKKIFFTVFYLKITSICGRNLKKKRKNLFGLMADSAPNTTISEKMVVISCG